MDEKNRVNVEREVLMFFKFIGRLKSSKKLEKIFLVGWFYNKR